MTLNSHLTRSQRNALLTSYLFFCAAFLLSHVDFSGVGSDTRVRDCEREPRTYKRIWGPIRVQGQSADQDALELKAFFSKFAMLTASSKLRIHLSCHILYSPENRGGLPD